MTPRHSRRLRAALAATITALVVATGAALVGRGGTPAPVADPGVLSVRQECQAALGYAARTAEDIKWLSDCEHALDPDRGTTPSPSSSPTAGPSPTGTPTPEPTTPSPTPSATPSPSPTPSPTPSPSPTPTGPQLNCMPNPHLCGWPDATNTGVPAGTTLRVITGSFTFSAGGVYQDLDIRGCTRVGGSNVTIRRVKIRCPGSLPIDIEDRPSITGVLIEDVEIDAAGQFNGRGIAGGGFTARRVWWHGGSDCSHFNSNVVIEDSYCDIPHYTGTADPHLDGFQSGGGAHVTLRHNTIRNANGQTSAIINGPDLRVLGPQTDVRIIDNLMSGGGYTVYCNAHSEQHPAQVPTVEFRGNRISREFYARGGGYGPMTDCAEVPGANTTIWDDTGLPIPPQ